MAMAKLMRRFIRQAGLSKQAALVTSSTRGASNQYLLSSLNVAFVAQSLQSGHRRYRYSRCLFVGQVGGFERDQVFLCADIFGKGATTGCAGQVPEHLIARLKLFNAAVGRLDPPGKVSPKDLVFWDGKDPQASVA